MPRLTSNNARCRLKKHGLNPCHERRMETNLHEYHGPGGLAINANAR